MKPPESSLLGTAGRTRLSPLGPPSGSPAGTWRSASQAPPLPRPPHTAARTAAAAAGHRQGHPRCPAGAADARTLAQGEAAGPQEHTAGPGQPTCRRGGTAPADSEAGVVTGGQRPRDTHCRTRPLHLPGQPRSALPPQPPQPPWSLRALTFREDLLSWKPISSGRKANLSLNDPL